MIFPLIAHILSSDYKFLLEMPLILKSLMNTSADDVN